MSGQTAAATPANPTYYDMTDAAFESALRTIVRASASEDEILTLSSGAMVMVIAHTPSGKVLQL